MSSQKFAVDQRLPQDLRPPTKTPTVLVRARPDVKPAIFLRASWRSRSVSATLLTGDCQVIPRLHKNLGKVLYLLISPDLETFIFSHRSHFPCIPARQRAPESPTRNAPIAD